KHRVIKGVLAPVFQKKKKSSIINFPIRKVYLKKKQRLFFFFKYENIGVFTFLLIAIIKFVCTNMKGTII
ncbi:hypothetical protein DD599_26760, partial [Enterobacter cloacae complex sp. CH23B]